MRISPAIERSTMLVLFLYPIFLLTVRGGMGWLFFTLLILSVVILLKNRPSPFDSIDFWFALAMSSIWVATVLSQTYHANFQFKYWDSPSRFLFAIPIYLALRNMNARVIAVLEVGFPLGAIFGLLVAIVIQYSQLSTLNSRWTVFFMNPIHFGNLSLLLGVLSLCSINWLRSDNRYLLVLKISGLMAGVYASIMSGTRGGWMAIPFMLLAWAYCQTQTKNTKVILQVIGITIILFIASYFLVDAVRLRVEQSIVEMVSISHGNLDTSIGWRLQLWQAAIIMFKENLLFGVGPDAFFQTMTSLQHEGLLSNVATETFGTEVHSFFFAVMAELGIAGLIAAIAIFFVPLILCFRASRLGNKYNRVAASMGACTVVGFFIFCFTVEMFNLKMIASFYALTVAVLLAAATSYQSKDRAVRTAL